MFFILSKLFFLFARPLHVLFLVMTLGLVLQIFRRRRVGIWLVNLAAIGLLLAAFSPIAALILLPLETRFPRPGVLDPAPDGILILGGGLDALNAVGRPDYIPLTEAGERLTEIPELARIYPNARIIYTGGPEHEGAALLGEAEAARKLLIQLGVPAERISIENHSLTTWENATLTKAMVNPAPGSRWLLVTSAFHMPRSVGTFRAAGWPGIIAFPTDYRLHDQQSGFISRQTAIENLDRLEVAAKEWYGMVGYWASGRSSALFPAP